MIDTVIIAGLFSVWVWTVLNDDEGIFAPVNGVLQKNAYTNKWMRCPWCSGAWFAIGSSFLLYHDPLIPAIIVAVAAAAITGLVGSYFQGD